MRQRSETRALSGEEASFFANIQFKDIKSIFLYVIMPPEIDMLILSFLGIKPYWRCKSYTGKNMICRNRTKKHQFFCSQHNKIIETQIANFPKIFNTIIIIYSHLWRKA